MKTKCLNCGGEIIQKEGARERKFCDNKNSCKQSYHNKHKKEPKYVLYKTFKDLEDKYNNVISKIDPKAGDMQEMNKGLQEAVKESISKKLKFTKVTKKSYEGKKLNRTKFDEVSQFKEPIPYPERKEHPKYNPKDPREGSAGFYLKYGVMNYDEL